ncbi:glycosyltransferase [Candidatus Parcubacteria bacterium]|nr:glycosyltransferase [Candidatus Parcubacteria bacterium]
MAPLPHPALEVPSEDGRLVLSDGGLFYPSNGEAKMRVSVIIPTMPGREALLKKLQSTIPSEYEQVVVGDTDILLAAKRNKGARQAKGEYLLFIDDDNYLQPGAIFQMLKEFDSDWVGVMGMVACYDDKKKLVADGGSIRWMTSGFMWGKNTNRRVYEIEDNIYLVSEVANAFMIRRDVFEEVGGFDEKNFPIDLDEADICKRIKNMGYLILMNPKARCYHKSQTYSAVPDFRRPMNAYMMGRNRILYQKKHLSRIKLFVYFSLFFPIFYFAYCACLIYRKKPGMVVHFTKGVIDGIQGRFQNQFQQG